MIKSDKPKNYSLEYNPELIKSPGCIEPHGVLLVLNENNYQITHVSENTEDFLGLKPCSLIGKNLKELFYPYQVPKNLPELTNNNHNNYQINLKIKLFTKIFQVLIHRNNNNIIIELENYLELKNNKNNLLETIKKSIYNLKKANNFTKLCQEIAVYIKNIIKYEKMMIYKNKKRSFLRDYKKIFGGKIYLSKKDRKY